MASPSFVSISLYVKNVPVTLDALHDRPSVQRRILVSCSFHVKIWPGRMFSRSRSFSLRLIRGIRERREASRRSSASSDVCTMPKNDSIMLQASDRVSGCSCCVGGKRQVSSDELFYKDRKGLGFYNSEKQGAQITWEAGTEFHIKRLHPVERYY